MSAIVRIGDLDGDGHEDVLARESATGILWFYPGAGAGLGARRQIGTGWNSIREITAAGDFNRDGLPDLLAIQSSTNTLYLYPGAAGARLGAKVQVGTGWSAYAELAGLGDFTGDGFPDLATRSTDGNLYLYPGNGTRFGARSQIGSGWAGMRDLAGAGDFDRDGHTDLAAVQVSDGALYLYRGTGSALLSRRTLATGFGGLTPVA
jgi:hypothetical protein